MLYYGMEPLIGFIEVVKNHSRPRPVPVIFLKRSSQTKSKGRISNNGYFKLGVTNGLVLALFSNSDQVIGRNLGVFDVCKHPEAVTTLLKIGMSGGFFLQRHDLIQCHPAAQFEFSIFFGETFLFDQCRFPSVLLMPWTEGLTLRKI